MRSGRLVAGGVGLTAAGVLVGAVPVGAQAGPEPADPPPPVGVEGEVLAPTLDVGGSGPLLAAFGQHSQQQGVGVNNPVSIKDSGGNGYRQMSVSFDQTTYRDVGVWGVGTKTVASTGKTILHEWSGTAASPSSGSITDSNTCTAPGISGLEVGLPSGVTVTAGTSSATQEGSVSTGAALHFERNYNFTFQCRVLAATPAKSTRWASAEMVWKNGSIGNRTSSQVFWW
jgi:hypothetical protein